jgi:predicted GNAT family N-acyltransferase
VSTIPVNPSDNLEVRCFTRASSPQDFERSIQLRREIFVTEQEGPLEDEPDHSDDEATHWILLNPQGIVIATGRMFDYQEACQTPPVAKIGRIAVKKEFRGQQLGDRVMREILSYVQKAGYKQSILDAQTYALKFYEKLGFVAEGFEFEEGGLPHKRMRLVLR